MKVFKHSKHLKGTTFFSELQQKLQILVLFTCKHFSWHLFSVVESGSIIACGYFTFRCHFHKLKFTDHNCTVQCVIGNACTHVTQTEGTSMPSEVLLCPLFCLRIITVLRFSTICWFSLS